MNFKKLVAASLMAAVPMIAVTAPADAAVPNKPCRTSVVWSADRDLAIGETGQLDVKVGKNCGPITLVVVQTVNADGTLSKGFVLPVGHKDGFRYNFTGYVDHSISYKVTVKPMRLTERVSTATYTWSQA